MRKGHRKPRRGAIAALTAVLLVVLLGMVAFAADVGYLVLARSELQRSADAAALAATWELIDPNELTVGGNVASIETNAQTTASQFAGLNSVLRQSPTVPDANVVVGYLSDLTDPNATIDTSGANFPNVVQVQVSRTSGQNGEVPFFLAGLLGVDSAATEAVSTAAMLTDIRGFRPPSDGSNLGILPFALDLDTWNDFLDGTGTDDWTWNAQTGQVERGSEGVLEMNLYPQGTGSPGNRGTVDIGGNNNSTADVARQILHGVTPSDLAHHGGALEFDAHGELILNGDTGISAGIKDELLAVKGEPRTIPLFVDVQGPGNNAQYTITKFAGIRIMEVKMTGSQKRVMIQPAQVVAEGAIPGDGSGTSHFIYSPAFIIR